MVMSKAAAAAAANHIMKSVPVESTLVARTSESAKRLGRLPLLAFPAETEEVK